MKAKVVEITRFGGPEVLRLREEEVRTPGPGEVGIQVKAAGLNFADIFERLGLYKASPKPPFAPGFEVSGVVDKVGEEVQSVQPGDRVIGVTRFGAYRTYLVLDQTLVRKMPPAFSFEEAAGFPTTYLTAYHGLVNLGHLQPGETVLIHSAAGGVGTAAVQIARIFNAQIFATCGSEEKVKFLREQGVKHVINYRTQDFAKEVRKSARGVDLIMDSVGGSTFRRGYKLLNPMGRHIIFGLSDLMPSGGKVNWPKLAIKYLRLPRFNPYHLMTDNKSIAGYNLVYLFEYLELFNESFARLLGWAEEGKLKPIIGKVFPFEQAAEAQTYLQSRKSIGKVILRVE
ncbi:MAG: hypothetical protein D6743_06805 [Calditrichaeota bacterium]|nr:MAG: hypothetical protein D6743_06805 [Calditrichota bacterium]